MKTLACINVSYGYENKLYQIFECVFQYKDGRQVKEMLLNGATFSTFDNMYTAVLKCCKWHSVKLPSYKEFNAWWYAVNWIDIFSGYGNFARYAYRGYGFKNGKI